MADNRFRETKFGNFGIVTLGKSQTFEISEYRHTDSIMLDSMRPPSQPSLFFILHVLHNELNLLPSYCCESYSCFSEPTEYRFFLCL